MSLTWKRLQETQRFEDAALLALTMEEGTMNQAMPKGPLEAGKSKQRFSSTRRNAVLPTPDNTSSVRLISTFWQPQLSGEFVLIQAKNLWCLLQQQQKIKTQRIPNTGCSYSLSKWFVCLACARPPRKTRLPLRAETSQVPKNISSVVKTKVANDQLY